MWLELSSSAAVLLVLQTHGSTGLPSPLKVEHRHIIHSAWWNRIEWQMTQLLLPFGNSVITKNALRWRSHWPGWVPEWPGSSKSPFSPSTEPCWRRTDFCPYKVLKCGGCLLKQHDLAYPNGYTTTLFHHKMLSVRHYAQLYEVPGEGQHILPSRSQSDKWEANKHKRQYVQYCTVTGKQNFCQRSLWAEVKMGRLSARKWHWREWCWRIIKPRKALYHT